MNAINVIAPYKYEGLWVFDDPRVGLIQEPFVGGADRIIDQMVAGLPDADSGFVLMFSAMEFPGYQFKLEWRRPDRSGNVYYEPSLNLEGWLCPALLRYFKEPPPEVFVLVKGKTRIDVY
jgi:hypothetical protein